jgi:mRNA interferase MazF
MNRGDVVIVDFPFADGTGSRVRPALVVQADDLNATLNATILAMITSSRNRMVGHPAQLVIDSSHPDFPASGLLTDSVIQCNILITRRQDLILRTIGALSGQTMKEIDECLKAALGIT